MASTSLSPERRAKLLDAIQKMEAAGETPEHIQGVVDHYKAKYAAPLPDGMRQTAPGPYPGMRANIMNAIPTPIPGLSAGRLTSIAPHALVLVGGAVGGPGGAAIGGGAGEAYRQALMEDQIDPRRIGTQGLVEGGSQLLGLGLAKGAMKASPFLARRAEALAAKSGGGLMDVLGGTGIGQMMGGHALHGAAAGAAKAAAQNPAVNRSLAKLLGSITFQRAARQSPRAAAAMVQKVLLSSEPDALSQK
jgi:hypothetical protein